MIRPSLFLDTDVCIKVANGTIPASEWQGVQREIGGRYRFCISFITLKELLVKLARGSDKHFEQNKGPLHVLYASGRRRFLPYPSVFTLREVLRLRSVARKHDSGLTEEQWAQAVLKAVIQAPSKTQLRAGIPVPGSTRRLRFDLDHFDKQANEPQREHAKLLQGIRDGSIQMSDPKKWAAWILHQHDRTPYSDDCEKLAMALDAAYRFTFSLSTMAKDQGYDFEKHESDWGDSVQLFYLCDPSMCVLTTDADFHNRTKESPQRDRILLYREFVKSLPR